MVPELRKENYYSKIILASFVNGSWLSAPGVPSSGQTLSISLSISSSWLVIVSTNVMHFENSFAEKMAFFIQNIAS
jgi:hypothetical protein